MMSNLKSETAEKEQETTQEKIEFIIKYIADAFKKDKVSTTEIENIITEKFKNAKENNYIDVSLFRDQIETYRKFIFLKNQKNNIENLNVRKVSNIKYTDKLQIVEKCLNKIIQVGLTPENIERTLDENLDLLEDIDSIEILHTIEQICPFSSSTATNTQVSELVYKYVQKLIDNGKIKKASELKLFWIDERVRLNEKNTKEEKGRISEIKELKGKQEKINYICDAIEEEKEIPAEGLEQIGKKRIYPTVRRTKNSNIKNVENIDFSKFIELIQKRERMLDENSLQRHVYDLKDIKEILTECILRLDIVQIREALEQCAEYIKPENITEIIRNIRLQSTMPRKEAIEEQKELVKKYYDLLEYDEIKKFKRRWKSDEKEGIIENTKVENTRKVDFNNITINELNSIVYDLSEEIEANKEEIEKAKILLEIQKSQQIIKEQQEKLKQVYKELSISK